MHNPKPPPGLPDNAVIRACEKAWRLPKHTIAGPKRDANICQARFSAALILREAGFSWWAIAREMNRNHGAIIKGVGRARVLLQWDAKFAKKHRRALANISAK